jgi:hypothetical protein
MRLGTVPDEGESWNTRWTKGGDRLGVPAYGWAVAIFDSVRTHFVGIFLTTNTVIVSELWSESSLGLAR